MILEGIVTTINHNGSANIAPMGPLVDDSMARLVLRTYKSSRTYGNLQRTKVGVFHITDDVELMARAAVGEVDPRPPLVDAQTIEGRVLADACRWYELRVSEMDDEQERAMIQCEVVHRGRIRDFLGFNRAKHAVIEAAILATRTALLPPEDILSQYERLSVIVNKTAGPQERRAFEYLTQYVEHALAACRPRGG